MKKYFVVADIHGFYDELIKALNDAGFDATNPNHYFISLGDALDRGNQPNEVLDFLVGLPKDRRIFIMGNHELLMDKALHRRYFLHHDFSNGTKHTAYAIGNSYNDEDACINMLNDPRWREYFFECDFYNEIDNNIFVHGWIPCHKYPNYYHEQYIPLEDWKKAEIYEWKDATWINGMEAWDNGIRLKDKTIWCGHWHTSWGHAHIHGEGVEFIRKDYDYEAFGITPVEHFEPFKDEGIVAMDACTAYSGFINCEVIEVNDD